MTSRFWTNDTGLALNANNLNSLEVDVQKGLDAFSAVSNITVNSWQPNTAYTTVGRYLLDPSGLVIKVATSHTSTATYDATKFTAVAPSTDATTAGWLSGTGTASNAALNAVIAGSTRTNFVPNPSFAKAIAGLNSATGTGGVVALSWQSGPGADGATPGFARVTWTTGTTGGGGGMNAGFVVTPATVPIPAGSYTSGDMFTVSAWVRASKATTVNWGSYFRAGTTQVTASSGQTAFALAANTWTRLSRTMPVSGAADNAYWYCYASGANTWGTGDTLDVDNVLIEKSTTLGDYFDGGTTGTSTTTNQWTGAAQASASTQRVVIPAVKPLMSRTGAPPVGRGEFVVNVADYLPADRVPGVTDDLPAFNAALAASSFGAIRVYVAPGEYWVSSAILLPSRCEFFGGGIGVSIIRLMTTSSLETWVVTNATPLAGGNQHIQIHDLTLDWQASTTRNGAGGGTRSSCLTLRNVQWFWIDRVEATNGGQHGIDISSGAIDYDYTGDGNPEPADPSRYGWIRNCRMDNWGDDGITTHHSEYLWIENNYGKNPRKPENCNAIEVDDGSRHVFLKNNLSENCYAGIEVKAHSNANAAQDVHIDGHISIRDVRSYHFRHIGHHIATDVKSKSAFDITASNLVSYFPGNRTGFQDDATPNALNISAFVNVSIVNFTAIGDPAYVFGGNIIELKYMTNNVSLKNFNLRNFNNAGGKDIYVTGGDNKADRVTIDGVNVVNSSPSVIGVGTGNPMVSISNINAVAPATGAAAAIDVGYSDANIHITDTLNLSGYPVAIRYNNTDYTVAEAYFRRMPDVPAGVTSMKNLSPYMDYYAGTTEFAAFTTDRPSGATGAYFITHSRVPGNSVIQTITRNTTGTTPIQYYRVLDTSTKVASLWQQTTVTGIAYSTT